MANQSSQAWYSPAQAPSFWPEPLMGLVWRVSVERNTRQPSLGTCRFSLERVLLHGLEMSVQSNTALGK